MAQVLMAASLEKEQLELALRSGQAHHRLHTEAKGRAIRRASLHEQMQPTVHGCTFMPKTSSPDKPPVRFARTTADQLAKPHFADPVSAKRFNDVKAEATQACTFKPAVAIGKRGKQLYKKTLLQNENGRQPSAHERLARDNREEVARRVKVGTTPT
jgi:hypothetical protein